MASSNEEKALTRDGSVYLDAIIKGVFASPPSFSFIIDTFSAIPESTETGGVLSTTTAAAPPVVNRQQQDEYNYPQQQDEYDYPLVDTPQALTSGGRFVEEAIIPPRTLRRHSLYDFDNYRIEQRRVERRIFDLEAEIQRMSADMKALQHLVTQLLTEAKGIAKTEPATVQRLLRSIHLP